MPRAFASGAAVSQRALERRRVDRRELRQRREPADQPLGLRATVLGKVQAPRAARQQASGRRRHAVADEEHEVLGGAGAAGIEAA